MVCYRKLVWVSLDPMFTEFHSGTLTNWAIMSRDRFPLTANYLHLLKFHTLLSAVFSFWSLSWLFAHWPQLQSWIRNHVFIITYLAKWTNKYGIHHRWVYRSCYRKLAWVRLEPTTTEFRSGALTKWAIRRYDQLVLTAIYSYSSFNHEMNKE